MNNSELLTELQNRITAGKLSKASVYKALSQSTDKEGEPGMLQRITVTHVLYSIGAIVVAAGIIALYAQIWSDLPSFMRILSTLGLGLVFAGSGSFILLNNEQKLLGIILHSLGGFVVPTGVMVTLAELSTSEPDPLILAFVFACISVFYGALTWIHKHALLTFCTIVHATIALYCLITHLLDYVSYRYELEVIAYTSIVIGINYLALTFNFKNNWNKALVSVLHFFGTNFILWSGFALVFEQFLWEFLYWAVSLALVYTALQFKSKSAMFSSTVALIAYISYITGEYFADSIGWPISLVFLGFVFIGLGYWSVRLTKEYIK